MRYLSIIVLFFLVACQPKPEFYIDGKPYYTQRRCVKDHTEFGPDITWQRFENKTVCDSSVIDTIEIKN